MGIFSKHWFHKLGADASSIGKKISSGTSNLLGGVANVANVLAKNPIVNTLTGGEGNALLSQVGNVAGQLGNTVNYKNYSGGVNQVSNQLQKNIQNTQNATGGASIFAQ